MMFRLASPSLSWLIWFELLWLVGKSVDWSALCWSASTGNGTEMVEWGFVVGILVGIVVILERIRLCQPIVWWKSARFPTILFSILHKQFANRNGHWYSRELSKWSEYWNSRNQIFQVNRTLLNIAVYCVIRQKDRLLTTISMQSGLVYLTIAVQACNSKHNWAISFCSHRRRT